MTGAITPCQLLYITGHMGGPRRKNEHITSYWRAKPPPPFFVICDAPWLYAYRDAWWKGRRRGEPPPAEEREEGYRAASMSAPSVIVCVDRPGEGGGGMLRVCVVRSRKK